jgi:MFS family permease
VKLKEPLVPMDLFSNYSWNAAVILTGLGASAYYAFTIVWPSMINVLYSDGGPMVAAWLSSLVGLCVLLSQIAGGFIGKRLGHLKRQAVVTMTIGAILFGCVATFTPDTRARASALVAFGIFFVGWTEGLAITIVTLAAENQSELVTASGVAGSIRFLISSIAATVYSVVLSNRVARTISAQVPPAPIEAVLPSTSIAGFISALSAGAAAVKAVPGVTEQIIVVGTREYQVANANAYRTVFLTNIAFSGVAIVCTLLLPEVDHLMTEHVATNLHARKKKCYGTLRR